MQDLSLRQQLSAAFHIACGYGWDQMIYNHFTARGETPGTFLVHRFGLLFSEVSASSLLEVSLETGQLLVPPPSAGEADMPYNSTAFVIHSCIYKARPDVSCVMHIHDPSIVAVAASKKGLIIGLSQESSFFIGKVGYHDYEGLATSLDEQERLAKNLGSGSVLFLRNHGVVCVGRNVAEAIHTLYHVWRACEIQTRTLCMGDYHVPPERVVQKAHDDAAAFTKSGNHNIAFRALVRQLLRQDPKHIFIQ